MATGDETRTCRDCGAVFTFTVRDQVFFASKGYDPPTRCPGCRQARKGGSSSHQKAPKVCFKCDGTGQIPCTMPTCVGGHIACPRCDGFGQIEFVYTRGMTIKAAFKDCPRCTRQGYPPGRLPCDRCRMAGYLTCLKCNGTGVIH